jgi:hypothetical protein
MSEEEELEEKGLNKLREFIHQGVERAPHDKETLKRFLKVRLQSIETATFIKINSSSFFL